ncbi:hypothetical protein A2973_05480 [Candidatus Gottesmanbacteria bacterium RIFCSPLOWO2_01_FULL_49_10]|uniref:Zinc finger DksA/TraR C4-type domain-containing protein n=1 Tax=Candidatus Gottesmanbacteria bacterium RIFCSPLOWO2_01_FULL_49_10 TaxID=1798396 RepID=A0A1F6B264_9BACT|nr:MAG: Transcriptional regulator, TraR/DksA family (Modular protein) [Microgenomates group bacterium GW2011_GWA2_47_8]OGG30627.1 MAG: hypothetical protein A2973_05480 [Candidatus Gottesmanbacteria bacterium RIFCSPLOWO2_01_FULL_49_10]
MDGYPIHVLSDIRRHLEEEKSRVAARITELVAQDPYADPERVNDNAATDTEANEESSHDRFAALVLQMKNQLSDIDSALVRIGEGTYGFCRSCGQMIDTDRLAVLPAATLCFSCEKKKNIR